MVELDFRFRCSFNFHKASSEIARAANRSCAGPPGIRKIFGKRKFTGRIGFMGALLCRQRFKDVPLSLGPAHREKPRSFCIFGGKRSSSTGLHIASGWRAFSRLAIPTLQGWLALPDVGDIFDSAQVMSIDIALRYNI